jgi:microcystin-dependent protein
MSEAFVGEIRLFAGNFAPRGWALADGQLLAINTNDALFSLYGTIYGGDGRTTFGLPDLRGRIPIHQGQGAALSPRTIGAEGGAETVTINQNQLPAHNHAPLNATAAAGNSRDPVSTTAAQAPGTATPTVFTDQVDTQTFPMSGQAIPAEGGSQAHSNLVPFQCINYIVCLYGIYPSRH